jgi:hypothetical protein
VPTRLNSATRLLQLLRINPIGIFPNIAFPVGSVQERLNVPPSLRQPLTGEPSTTRLLDNQGTRGGTTHQGGPMSAEESAYFKAEYEKQTAQSQPQTQTPAIRPPVPNPLVGMSGAATAVAVAAATAAALTLDREGQESAVQKPVVSGPGVLDKPIPEMPSDEPHSRPVIQHVPEDKPVLDVPVVPSAPPHPVPVVEHVPAPTSVIPIRFQDLSAFPTYTRRRRRRRNPFFSL